MKITYFYLCLTDLILSAQKTPQCFLPVVLSFFFPQTDFLTRHIKPSTQEQHYCKPLNC